MRALVWLAFVGATLAALPASAGPGKRKRSKSEDSGIVDSKAKPGEADATAKPRKFMVGLEGVVIQAPPIRTTAIDLDPRFVGKTVALGGLGIFGRYRPVPLVAFDIGVRSGSIRYRDRSGDDSVSQDLILGEAGVLLYLARGQVAQFALDAGLGGMGQRVRYDLGAGRKGTQTFGVGFVRAGANAEFLVKRIAFVLSVRSYALFLDRDRVSNKGDLFDGASAEARRAPVATLQTYLIATGGIAFRF